MRLIRRPSVAFALGVVVAVCAVAGRAAFGAGDAGQVHACYKQSNGLLYVVGSGGRAACQPGDVPLDWNVQGPVGPAGPAGPQGDPGAPGAGIVNSALAPGDANCPYGGTAFTGAGGTTYACNGAPGADGAQGAQGPPGVFSGTFTSPDGTSRLHVLDGGVIRLDTPNARLSLDAGGITVDSALALMLKGATTAKLQGGVSATLAGGVAEVDGAAALTNGNPIAHAGGLVLLSGVPVSGGDCGCFANGTGTILP